MQPPTQLLRSLALSAVFSLMVGPALAAPVLEAAPASVSVTPDARILAERSEQDLLAGKLAELDYAATKPLRDMIGAIFHALEHERSLPEGLKQHQHPPL